MMIREPKVKIFDNYLNADKLEEDINRFFHINSADAKIISVSYQTTVVRRSVVHSAMVFYKAIWV